VRRAHQDRLSGATARRHRDGLSVSPDGRSVLFGRAREQSNLMMIESFR
jgi:hypothetical protein